MYIAKQVLVAASMIFSTKAKTMRLNRFVDQSISIDKSMHNSGR